MYGVALCGRITRDSNNQGAHDEGNRVAHGLSSLLHVDNQLRGRRARGDAVDRAEANVIAAGRRGCRERSLLAERHTQQVAYARRGAAFEDVAANVCTACPGECHRSGAHIRDKLLWCEGRIGVEQNRSAATSLFGSDATATIAPRSLIAAVSHTIHP